MYIEFMSYKLRLDAKRIVELEKKLGGSPLSAFMKDGQVTSPTLQNLLLILHIALLPFQSGIKEEDMFEIYDKWVESGKTYSDLVIVVTDLYRECGLIPKEDSVVDSKN